jgi:anti-sigma-K factor RskA
VTIDNDKIQDLLIGEAFGTLDKVDAQELRELLMKQPELRAELENWRETAALVALDTPLLEPSDKVRENLLKQVWFDKKDKEQTAESTKAENLPEEKTVEETLEETKPNIVQFPKRRSWSFAQKTFAIAASLVIAFLGLGLIKTWSDVQNSNAEIAELRQKLNETQADLNATQADLAKSRELLTTNSTIVALAGLKDSPNAKAKLIFDQESGKAVLVFEGLPPAPSGKAYQLWVIADNKPVSGGIFKTDSNGRGELASEVPQNGRQKGVFAVTLEPEEGVPAPTGSMFLKS